MENSGDVVLPGKRKSLPRWAKKALKIDNTPEWIKRLMDFEFETPAWVKETLEGMEIDLDRLNPEEKGTLVFSVCMILIVLGNWRSLLASFKPLSSPVDWCETNYAVHGHIAEFWNTVSSFALIFVGAVSPQFIDAKIKAVEPKIWMIFAIMIFVGVGSVLFHATLSVAFQVLDELPIVLLAVYGSLMIRPLKKWDMRYRNIVMNDTFFVCAVIGSTIICMVFPMFSHLLTISMIPVVFYAYFEAYLTANKTAQKQALKLFSVTVASFCLAWTCWMIDRLMCSKLNKLRFNPQLHAWWHVLVSVTFSAGVSTAIILRSNAEGLKTKLVIPRVVVVD